MEWDNDFDVKEYRPRKKKSPGGAVSAAPDMDNSISVPGVPAMKASEAYSRDGIAELDGGVMLTTSEILDFSASSDSY